MTQTDSYVRSQRHLPPKFDHFVKEYIPGVAVPDFELTDVDGNPVRLSHLWAESPLILEFGSAT